MAQPVHRLSIALKTARLSSSVVRMHLIVYQRCVCLHVCV